MQRPPVEARRVLRVHGIVQGVGFRPHVFRVAAELGLAGRVRNIDGSVEIDVEGPRAAVDDFEFNLLVAKPAHAIVTKIDARDEPPLGRSIFTIDESLDSPRPHPIAIPPDLGPCAACLGDAARGRRESYPFTTCTECGPRYTIARALPYDRFRTSMVRFPLCAECRSEYDDPRDRRFHAETQACPRCGPRLVLEEVPPASPHSDRDIPFAMRSEGAAALRDARGIVEVRHGILALHGVGGFQLACDATDEAAVAELRRLKKRGEKPLAVLVRGIDVAERFVELVPGAVEALTSPARPIVLLPRRAGSRIAASVAPGLPELGVMLPASPLHALLVGDTPWVLTSGNVSDEPIAIDTETARRKLAPIAAAVLRHDREIVAGADDSVVQMHGGAARVLRRARGYVPGAIALSAARRDVLALGGDLKNTICVVKEGAAVLSPHLGDLSSPEVEERLHATWRHLRALLRVEPRAVACDAHPDYVSSRIARALADELGVEVVPVQHHHAHVAACLAEHGREGPALALVLDGSGHGADGTVWGGELLHADLRSAKRLGRLRPVGLVGGDRAASEPWRSAVAHLVDAGLPVVVPGVEPAKLEAVAELARKRVAAPLASSAGRLFDAVAALTGVRTERGYEGQAAQLLEAAARGEGEPYRFAVTASGEGGLIEVDTRPIIEDVARAARERPAAEVSARFHATLAAALVALVEAAVIEARTVVLAGGCFQNRRLLALVEAGLAARGFAVLYPRSVPAGDGGLSLGQAAIAAARR